jgi:membrane fusion protein, copper/silver efflux system
MSIKSNRKFWILLKLLIVIISGMIAYGCIQNNRKSGKMQQNQAEAKEKVYVCSMHPQVIQSNPGDCPICGMMLIEKVSQNGPTKEKEYVCSMHPQVIQNKPGDCPICGMILIEKVSQNDLKKEKVYVCSMHPQVIQNKPGDCPICGMMLIEKHDQTESQVPDELIDITRPVNESVMASVQTIIPSQTKLPLIIAASGIINFDSHRISTVSAKFGGLIERSYVKFAYQLIRRGQKIYDIYCPEIYYDHWNYINIMKKFPDQPNLNQEARHWLELLGLTDQQIEEIIKAEKLNYHLSVYSQVEGFAVSPDFNPELSDQGKPRADNEGISLENAGISLKEGQVIQAGTPLFKVLNTDRVRADLKVRTEDMGLLKKGQKVVITDAVSPDRMFNATVSQIEPLNGGLFQLVKVYITDNEKLLLPGRQIQAYIQAGDKNTLWVPKSAVVNLGQKKLVFLLADKTFVAINISTGLQSGDHIEVLSGIDTTSQIALNASLLTDSDGFIKSN